MKFKGSWTDSGEAGQVSGNHDSEAQTILMAVVRQTETRAHFLNDTQADWFTYTHTHTAWLTINQEATWMGRSSLPPPPRLCSSNSFKDLSGWGEGGIVGHTEATSSAAHPECPTCLRLSALPVCELFILDGMQVSPWGHHLSPSYK